MRIISYVEGQLSSLNRNSRISTQHWISLNLFTFRPTLIGNVCLFGGGEYPGKVCDIGFETPCIHKSRLKGSFITMSKKMTTFWLQNFRCLPINTVKVWPHFLTKYWRFHSLAIALPSLEFPSLLHLIIKQTCTYRSRWKFSPSYTRNLLKTPSYIIV